MPVDKLAESVDFWRGAIDGDGWIGWSSGPFIGLSGQASIIDTFIRFIHKHFGFVCNKNLTKSGVWRVQIGSFGSWTNETDTLRVINLFYGNATEALERKHGRAKAMLSGRHEKFAPYDEGPARIVG